MDCSPPGSFVHGIFQERILEWVVISYSRGSSQPRNWTHISCTGRQILYHCAILGRLDTCICMAESLHCSPKTITTLLISYTPIQTTKLKKIQKQNTKKQTYGYESRKVAAAESLQSCPTLCDPIDGSPPGSPNPGILQARTLEWVAISFSNAWKWKVKGKSLSRVRPSAITQGTLLNIL